MIFRFFKKKKDTHELKNNVIKIQDIELEIIPNFSIGSKIIITKEEQEMIGKIICEEKANSIGHCGYTIAERVCKEVRPEVICAVDVDGSNDGLKWEVKLSDFPF